MDISPQPELSKEITELTKAVRRSNSFIRVFFLGIVRGLGVAIGATIVAAIAVTLLWRAARTLKLDQFLGGEAGGPPSGVLELLQQLPAFKNLDPALLDPAKTK